MELFNLFKRKEKSKNIAKERLKLVLVHDRGDLSPQFIDNITKEIVKVISQYAEIEEEGLNIKLTRMKKEDDSIGSALVANIPIKSIKDGKRY